MLTVSSSKWLCFIAILAATITVCAIQFQNSLAIADLSSANKITPLSKAERVKWVMLRPSELVPEHKNLIGLTKREVKEVLGQPDSVCLFGNDTLRYYLDKPADVPYTSGGTMLQISFLGNRSSSVNLVSYSCGVGCRRFKPF